MKNIYKNNPEHSHHWDICKREFKEWVRTQRSHGINISFEAFFDVIHLSFVKWDRNYVPWSGIVSIAMVTGDVVIFVRWFYPYLSSLLTQSRLSQFYIMNIGLTDFLCTLKTIQPSLRISNNIYCKTQAKKNYFFPGISKAMHDLRLRQAFSRI